MQDDGRRSFAFPEPFDPDVFSAPIFAARIDRRPRDGPSATRPQAFDRGPCGDGTWALQQLSDGLLCYDELPMHTHRRGQLVVATRGSVLCRVSDGLWIVPPHSAVWIPGGMPHSNSMAINSTLYCVYIEESRASLPAHCCTLTLTPLLRELVFSVAQLPRDYAADTRESRLAQVLSDELSVASIGNRHISLPDNARLRQLAENVIKNPADRRNIAHWARQVGMSERTLTRFMHREIGMTFGQWRSQLNILMAVQQLLSGSSVQNIALDLGYDSVSAFISMFKKILGKSPGRYLSDLRRHDHDLAEGEHRM